MLTSHDTPVERLGPDRNDNVLANTLKNLGAGNDEAIELDLLARLEVPHFSLAVLIGNLETPR